MTNASDFIFIIFISYNRVYFLFYAIFKRFFIQNQKNQIKMEAGGDPFVSCGNKIEIPFGIILI
jgi:hypothetical protein